MGRISAPIRLVWDAQAGNRDHKSGVRGLLEPLCESLRALCQRITSGPAKANAVHNPRSLGGKKDCAVGSPRVGNTRRGDNTRGYSHSNSQTRHDPHDTPKCPRPLINSIRQFTNRAIRFAWRNLNNAKLCMREIVQRELCSANCACYRQWHDGRARSLGPQSTFDAVSSQVLANSR